jgi:spermidine/putrescine transport system ATP-binding protein
MTMSDRIAVMNRGHYEQVGTPEELYERPTTRFVAGFLGVSNMLRGSRIGDDGDYVLVRVVGGAQVRVPRERLDGRGDIEVGVRPEKIRMLPAGAAGADRLNRLEGRIIDASYMGVSTQYIVRVADDTDLTVYEQNVERTEEGSLHRPGESVGLTWIPEHTFAIHKAATEEAGQKP